jgi:hypothetical protein
MYARITVQTTRTSKRGIFLQMEIEFLADDEPLVILRLLLLLPLVIKGDNLEFLIVVVMLGYHV